MSDPEPAAPSAVADAWVAAFNTNDPETVVALYTPDALLHGTSNPALRAGTDAIRGYFQGVRGSGLHATIGECHTVTLGDAAMDVGFYHFVADRDGARVESFARFTFVAVRRNGKWAIAHHHSSALPPAPP
jgi:uncharacterized protein (TIGR02246 family)